MILRTLGDGRITLGKPRASGDDPELNVSQAGEGG